MTDLNAFLPYVNGPLGFVFRSALWISDRRHRIARIDPNGHHLDLGGGKYRAVLYASDQHTKAAYKNLDWFMHSAHRWDAFAPAFDLGFATYTEQPDATDGNDTMIIQENPTTNYGTETGLYIGENYGSTQLARTLIKFDLSAVPTLYISDDATFSLWHYSDQSNNTRNIALYRLKRNWVETEANWNNYASGSAWSTAGGFDTSDCESGTNVGVRSFSATESTGKKDWSVDAKSLEDMCNGVWTNYGWLIKAWTEDNDQHRFRSSDYTTSTERPKLTFEYYPQDPGGLLL